MTEPLTDSSCATHPAAAERNRLLAVHITGRACAGTWASGDVQTRGRECWGDVLQAKVDVTPNAEEVEATQYVTREELLFMMLPDSGGDVTEDNGT